MPRGKIDEGVPEGQCDLVKALLDSLRLEFDVFSDGDTESESSGDERLPAT